jgi:alpha-tubulin suppressor-like RCC1 family protein
MTPYLHLGQCGDGSIVGRPYPVLVNTNIPIVDISAGIFHSMLLSAAGAVYTFGA